MSVTRESLMAEADALEADPAATVEQVHALFRKAGEWWFRTEGRIPDSPELRHRAWALRASEAVAIARQTEVRGGAAQRADNDPSSALRSSWGTTS